jgi:16S rRNA (cytosine967-C5)-methyltransferase
MNVRLAAIEIVLAAEQSGRFVDQVLSVRLRAAGDLDPRDRSLLTELVFGPVRHRLTLDQVLSAFAARPLARTPRFALEAMRQALHQVLFLDRIPAAAAVNEAVALTRRRVAEPVARFANAVLRHATAAAKRVGESSPEDDPRAVLPVRPGKAFVFDRSIFADPATDPLLHIAQTLSYPPWLFSRWAARWGTAEADALARAQNEAPDLVLRLQPLRTTAEEYGVLLAERGIASELLDDAAGLLRLRSAGAVEDLPGYGDGLFSVQDRNAASVVAFLDPLPNEAILDLCAAPGGKATQIAERQEDRGSVLAVDVSSRRLALVEQNASRLRLGSIETLAIDGRRIAERFAGRFDRVLLDAPCSNTGVLARRPEARWRVGEGSLRSLTVLQGELLEAAAGSLRPGGTLVYSTCSLEPEENRERIEAFLAGHDRWSLEGIVERWPHRDGGDGVFAARLRFHERSASAGDRPKML